jgi:hypothetical protein
LRYTRTALLLMLSLSLGVFALSYSATWTSSQQDQAAYQAGADVRATAVHQAGQSSVLPAAYTSVPGVETAMPVERIENGIPLTDGNIDLLALEPDAASSIVHFRSDEASQPLPELMTALRDGRPNLALASLPPDAEFLRVNALLDISTILSFPDPGSSDSVELDPATLTGLRANATATVRDARGLIYRLSSSDVEFTDKTAAIVMPLKPAAATASLEGPLQLAAVDVVVSEPRAPLVNTAPVGGSGLAASASADGPWSAIPSDAWAARMASGRAAPKAVSSSSLSGMVVQIGGAQGEPFINGGVNGGRVFFISSAIDSLGHDDATVPVIANPALLSATGTAVGQTIDMTVDRLKRHLSIAGVVDSFPTTDPSRPLLIFDQPTLDLLRLQATSTNRNVDEWWLSVAPGASDQVAAALREEPFDHSDVVSADGRARGLSTDPVALGIIGALLLGFVATGIFALVALVVSAAVSARQRRTEFALMRALGLSGRQLSGWLWLENGSLVVVSLIAGTLLGIVISLIALPFITVTQQATTPIPGVLVQMPWDRILMLDVVVLIALGVAVGILAAVLRRIGVGSILRLGGD